MSIDNADRRNRLAAEPQHPHAVLLWSQDGIAPAAPILTRFGIELHRSSADSPIPGSYFGESEAGLIGNRLYLRPDTPLHSALHEACHCSSSKFKTIML
jgi:hypothetical protein